MARPLDASASVNVDNSSRAVLTQMTRCHMQENFAEGSAGTGNRRPALAKTFPLHPTHPERICWGCDHYCPAKDMRCGNGQSRTQHPCELLGDDWYEHGDWGIEVAPAVNRAG